MTAIASTSSSISLDRAIYRGDISGVRSLLSLKATPSKTSFQCAGDNAQMLLTLLNTTASHLKTCTNLASLCDAIFPPITELSSDLQKHLEALALPEPFNRFVEVVKKTDYKNIKCSHFSVMERIAQKRGVEIPETDRLEALNACTLSCPIGTVREVLVEMHPLFAEAWKLSQPLQLVKSIDPSLKSNFKTDPMRHTLTIGKPKNVEDLFKMLINGTILYLNGQFFVSLKNNTPPRESWILQGLYVDHLSKQYRGTIMCSLFGEQKPQSFDSFCKMELDSARTAKLRKDWNTKLSYHFFAQNPGFLNRKVKDDEKAP